MWRHSTDSFVANFEGWLQVVTSLLALAMTILGVINRRHLTRVEVKTDAAHNTAKEAHNALVELADIRAQELADHIDRKTLKFPAREETNGT